MSGKQGDPAFSTAMMKQYNWMTEVPNLSHCLPLPSSSWCRGIQFAPLLQHPRCSPEGKYPPIGRGSIFSPHKTEAPGVKSAWKSHFFFGGGSFCLFRTAPSAYGGSQERGLIGATAAGLCCSHSSTISELHLRPTPQITATPDPQPTEWGQGPNPSPHGY